LNAAPDSIDVAPDFGTERRQGFRLDADVEASAEGLGMRLLMNCADTSRALRLCIRVSDGGKLMYDGPAMRDGPKIFRGMILSHG
jgi:hypothetical protein